MAADTSYRSAAVKIDGVALSPSGAKVVTPLPSQHRGYAGVTVDITNDAPQSLSGFVRD
jgi:hypothetical protein